MCNCISYNRPEVSGGAIAEVVLDKPIWMSKERKTVCIDSCIVEYILLLWANKIETLGCCCGHNNLFDRNVIVNSIDHLAAETLLKNTDLQVVSWQLCLQAPIAQGNKLC